MLCDGKLVGLERRPVAEHRVCGHNLDEVLDHTSPCDRRRVRPFGSLVSEKNRLFTHVHTLRLSLSH